MSPGNSRTQWDPCQRSMTSIVCSGLVVLLGLTSTVLAWQVVEEPSPKPGRAAEAQKKPPKKKAADSPEKGTAASATKDGWTDEALFKDMLDNHWSLIFPDGWRNVGGPQFFKYIYEHLATSHDLFERYNQFYCGVSGAIVRPGDHVRYDVVKIKDNQGRCVVGKYYRCCWPCSCDIMKHARVEQATLRLPRDPSGREETYWVLTIGDPCHRCASSPCPDLPSAVTTYKCKDHVTANGLRVSKGRLTTANSGRLVFAVLHDAAPADQATAAVAADLLRRCTPRINASPAELTEMGGMGNIFVDVARVHPDVALTNSMDDLCK